jgi:hypothetical protein
VETGAAGLEAVETEVGAASGAEARGWVALEVGGMAEAAVEAGLGEEATETAEMETGAGTEEAARVAAAWAAEATAR